MESINSLERKKKIITLGILLTVTVVLLIILAASFSQFQSTEAATALKGGNDASSTDLTSINQSFNSRLNKLQEYDDQYADMLTDSSREKNFGTLNLTIARQEEMFRLTIDSLERAVDKIEDENAKDQALEMISTFKTLLQSRKAVATLRNAVAVSNPAFSAEQKQTLELQNELMDKDEKIAALETSLAIAESQKTQLSQPSSVAVANAGNNETKLKENIVLLENKVSSLTEANNTLKDQNDQLKQRPLAQASAASPDVDLKAKNVSLQQKVDELNAALRLAQVDCNISRVDATQIISNSRQRKQLLSEASSILTDLSSVNSADVRQKVKEKIAKLNQVAANSRE